MSIIQQLEDLKEWSQDSTRYERRLNFRSGQLVQPGPGRQGYQWGSSYKKSKGDVWDRKTKEWRKPRYVSADHADEANKVINNYKKFVAKNYSMKGDLKGAPALDTYLTNKYGKVEAKNLTYKIGKFTNFEPRSYLQEQKLNLAEGLVNKLNTNLKFFEGGKKGILNKVGSIGVRPDVNEFTTKLHKILDGLDSREKKVVKGLNYIVDSDLPLKSADRGLVNRQGVLRSMLFDLTGVDTGAEAFTTGIKKASRQVAKKLNITPKEFEDTFKYLNRTARKNSNLINVPFNQAFEFGSQRLKGAAELGGRDFLQFYRDPNTNIMNYIFRHWDRNNFSGTNSRVKLYDRSKVKLVDGNLVPKKGYTLKDIELEWKSGKKYKVGEFAFSYDGKQLFDVTTLRTKGKESGLFDEVYKATNDYYKLYNRKIPDPKNPGKTIDFGEMMTRDHGKNSMAIGHNAPGGIKTQPLKNFQIQSQKMNTAIYQATKHIQNKDLQKRVLQNIYGDLKNLKGDRYVEAFVKNPPSTTYREAGQMIITEPKGNWMNWSQRKQSELFKISGIKAKDISALNEMKPTQKISMLKKLGFKCRLQGGTGESVDCYMKDVEETHGLAKKGDQKAIRKLGDAYDFAKQLPKIGKVIRQGFQAVAAAPINFLKWTGLGTTGGLLLEGLLEGGIYKYYTDYEGYTPKQAFAETFTPRLTWEALQGKSTEDVPWYGGAEKLVEKELYEVKDEEGNITGIKENVRDYIENNAAMDKLNSEWGTLQTQKQHIGLAQGRGYDMTGQLKKVEAREKEMADEFYKLEQLNKPDALSGNYNAWLAAKEKQDTEQGFRKVEAQKKRYIGDEESREERWEKEQAEKRQKEMFDLFPIYSPSQIDPVLDYWKTTQPQTGLSYNQLSEIFRDQDKSAYFADNFRTEKAGGGIAGIRRPWAIPPESGPDPQGIIPRPGYQQGNRVNPFEETGNLPGGAYDAREYIKSPILQDNKGITTVEAPPKEDKRTFEEIIESVVGKAKDRPKHYKLDEEGNIITPRAGPQAGIGTGYQSMESLNKVIGAVDAANLSKENSDYFWNKFGIEFGLSGNELKSLKKGKKFLNKENIPLISLDEDALLSFTKGLNLPGNTAATIFAESNLGGDVNASLELANKYFKTKITEDDVSWDIKPTFNVGKTEISPSVKGTDDVIEKIKLAVGNPNWSIEGELIKAQKRKETGGAPDQETQRIMQMLMADPMLWRLFGGSRGMMQMFGDTMTEEQKGDILKLSGSYTFDKGITINPNLKTDLLTHDTTYGLGINQGNFSANLDYDKGLTGSLSYGPVQVGSTGDGARLDFNKDMGNFNLKANVDTEGNWFIGPQWKWTWGGKKEEPYYTEGKNLAELQEALQPKKLYARGGLASLNNYATKRTG